MIVACLMVVAAAERPVADGFAEKAPVPVRSLGEKRRRLLRQESVPIEAVSRRSARRLAIRDARVRRGARAVVPYRSDVDKLSVLTWHCGGVTRGDRDHWAAAQRG